MSKLENILVGNWTTHALVKVPKMFLTSGGQRFHSWRHNKDGEIKMADEVNFQRWFLGSKCACIEENIKDL